jgi:hypothetical protein
LSKKFFLKIGQVDLSNTIKETYIKHIVLISNKVTKQQIKDTIYKLLNRKALRPDRILNKVLKLVTLIIVKDLAYAISNCLVSRLLLLRYKESTIIVL